MRNILYLSLYILLFLNTNNSVSAYECNHSYKFTSAGDSATLYRKYSGSIFHISVPNADVSLIPGTGFLIDVERDLVITSSHVLGDTTKLCRNENDENCNYITGKSSVFIDDEVTFILVADLLDSQNPVDMAIIRAIEYDKNKWDKLISIEISFSLPSQSEQVTVFGYPKNFNGTLSTKEVTITTEEMEDRNLLSQYNFIEGNSGGPVINNQGLSLAINYEQHPYEEKTIHIPFARAAHFLEFIQIKSEIKYLIEQLTDEKVSLHQWEQFLLPPPAPLSMSNLSLLLLASAIDEMHIEDFDELKLTTLKSKIICIRSAISDRDLFNATTLYNGIFTYLDPKEAGRDLIKHANNISFVDKNLELASFRRAKNYIEEAIIIDYNANEQQYISSALSHGLSVKSIKTGDKKYRDDQIIAAAPTNSLILTKSSDFPPTNKPKVELSNSTAALLRDYAHINENIAKLTDSQKESYNSYVAATNASILASTVSSQKLKGAAFAHLAGSYRWAGLYDYAYLSDATACKLNYCYNWVIDNWGYSKNQLTGRQSTTIPIVEDISNSSYIQNDTTWVYTTFELSNNEKWSENFDRTTRMLVPAEAIE